MAVCANCGQQIAEDARFCPNCANPSGASSNTASSSSSGGAGALGLDENIAGLLSYLLGWVSGLVFFIIDKRPFVRFHAAQSIVVFGGLQVLYIVLARVFFLGIGIYLGGSLLGAIQLLALALAIVLMIKAYQRERFKLPIAGDLAESIFKALILPRWESWKTV
jgi:uncharacterized membrane protein